MNAQFLDIHSAADYIGPGAVEVPFYQTEITDLVRRRGMFGQRIKQVPATGHPSRYFEQTAIPNPGTAGFVDPRNITPSLVTPTRVERSVPLKGLVAQLNYNLFDMELGAQQKQFAYLQAKDLIDTVDGVLHTHDVALWNGNDTSLSAPTSTAVLWRGQPDCRGRQCSYDHDHREHCGRDQVAGCADGVEHQLRRAPDRDLCQPGVA